MVFKTNLVLLVIYTPLALNPNSTWGTFCSFTVILGTVPVSGTQATFRGLAPLGLTSQIEHEHELFYC